MFSPRRVTHQVKTVAFAADVIPGQGGRPAQYSLAHGQGRPSHTRAPANASGSKGKRRRKSSIQRKATLAQMVGGGGATLTNVEELVGGSERNVTRLRRAAMSDSNVISADELIIQAKLGEGGFGVVYKCRYYPKAGVPVPTFLLDDDFTVAVKQLKPEMPEEPADRQSPPPEAKPSPEATNQDVADFAVELLTLKSLAHPHVIGFVGVGVFKDEQGADSVAIVQEFASHGSLKPLVNSENSFVRPFSVADGLRWAQHVASGMAFLHSCRPMIIHRDLKPENILLCGPTYVAKIADFGLVTFMRKGGVFDMAAALQKAAGGQVNTFDMTGMVGSLRYMSPENYRGESYSHKNDVFSYAIILYELLMRTRAYGELYLKVETIAEKAAANELRPSMPSKWPEEVKSLLTACWHDDPAERPEFTDIEAKLREWRDDDHAVVLHKIERHCRKGVLEHFGCLGRVSPSYSTKAGDGHGHQDQHNN
eukprot:CAMPEP_0205999626 /NCGR_PEP_ID=MMETSP1464-20131121/965_1 /ASSEMBLY_ACC=CAM_ASM_001124 /TAXON_ID=119497 /ORGANISM="Exanthemachrysis gayraliae, Strain RCC1523" /LENGTH=479 /DNA_ID=CAMNT_0053372837 /DNA_START=1 /DNA_END=1440 /DNA_ORIENTATION=+